MKVSCSAIPASDTIASFLAGHGLLCEHRFGLCPLDRSGIAWLFEASATSPGSSSACRTDVLRLRVFVHWELGKMAWKAQ